LFQKAIGQSALLKEAAGEASPPLPDWTNNRAACTILFILSRNVHHFYTPLLQSRAKRVMV